MNSFVFSPRSSESTSATSVPTNTEQTVPMLSLQAIAPDLTQFLQKALSHEYRLTERMALNINILQDTFLRHWQLFLEQYAITTSEKLTLGLNAQQHLYVTCDHPQKHTIDEALRSDQECYNFFKAIAVQAAALQALCTLHALVLRPETPETPSPQMEINYRLYTKGDMHHFYFL